MVDHGSPPAFWTISPFRLVKRRIRLRQVAGLFQFDLIVWIQCFAFVRPLSSIAPSSSSSSSLSPGQDGPRQAICPTHPPYENPYNTLKRRAEGGERGGGPTARGRAWRGEEDRTGANAPDDAGFTKEVLDRSSGKLERNGSWQGMKGHGSGHAPGLVDLSIVPEGRKSGNFFFLFSDLFGGCLIMCVEISVENGLRGWI